MSSRGVNKVILIGHLGQDPEVRHVPNGGQVATIRVATSEQWKDRDSRETRENTEWHRVVFFGRLAEIAGEYLRKGSQVYIEGRFQTRKWQGQDGQDRYTTEIVASEMQMLGGDRGASAGRESSSAPRSTSTRAYRDAQNGNAAPPPPASGGHSADPGFGEDDIPFVEVDWRGA